SNKKARIGVQKSWVWDHFIKIENNKRSMCKHCKVTKYKIGGKSHGTSNMIHHLEKCAKYKETLPKVAGGQQTLDFQPCKPGEEPQLVGVSFSQAGCRRALIRFIITDEMAFRIVHGEGFRAFCKYLEPRFKIPGRMTVYRDVISL
ncbi:hypothetical protein MKW94_003319, partial [Papaver nudicaule]|nr:hypothetical protein [Papaver nudicaule]